ncbi:MAG: response regulator transcription factor [Desulfobacterales bacterium]|nr:response regulator transcription factor [Desulfobacterales bacterium]
MHILVVEDDYNIRCGLVDTLESEGYVVSSAIDGNDALKQFNEKDIDLLLLDIMMPGKSGFDVCKTIRSVNEDIPIIMLTAKGEEIDKVLGLTLGADDYITKPFGIRELLARIEAVIRRTSRIQKTIKNNDTDIFYLGEAEINPREYKIKLKNKEFDISSKELKILSLFYSNPNDVLTRDKLLNEVWGINYFGTTRTLDQHIAQLRKKIEIDPANPQIILTVHGIGYKYKK